LTNQLLSQFSVRLDCDHVISIAKVANCAFLIVQRANKAVHCNAQAQSLIASHNSVSSKQAHKKHANVHFDDASGWSKAHALDAGKSTSHDTVKVREHALQCVLLKLCQHAPSQAILRMSIARHAHFSPVHNSNNNAVVMWTVVCDVTISDVMKHAILLVVLPASYTVQAYKLSSVTRNVARRASDHSPSFFLLLLLFLLLVLHLVCVLNIK